MRGRRHARVPLVCVPFKALGIYRPQYQRHGCVVVWAPPRIPKPLGRRKRELSPSFEGRLELTHELERSRWWLSSQSKTARSQSQSPLLNLPPELQAQVWRECLGGFIFHVEIRDTKLQRKSSSTHLEMSTGNKFLSLPLTCRLMWVLQRR